MILADAGYGADGGFRAGLSGLDLIYVVGVQPTLSVWRPGEDPPPPKPWSGRGRPPSLMRRSPEHKAWELDDAAKAEKLIRNLARRLDQDRPGVSASILEGLDEILTVVQLKLPMELRRSLACTNIAENMMGTIRRVTRNVKRWRNGKMALRWVAAGMIEAPRASANSRLTSSCRPCAPHLSPIRIASPKSPLLRHRGLRNMRSRNLAQPKFNKLRDISCSLRVPCTVQCHRSVGLTGLAFLARTDGHSRFPATHSRYQATKARTPSSTLVA